MHNLMKVYYPGNVSYSVKVVEENKVVDTIRYLCKGLSKDDAPDVRFNDGYIVEDLHDAYWQINVDGHR